MAMIRAGRFVPVVAAAALLGGCGKTVSLSFLNLTDDTLNVYVTTPNEGRRSIGLVPPLGRIEHTIIIPDDRLPATCAWQVGSVSRAFTVTKETGDQEVKVLPTGAARMRDRDSSLKDMLEPEIHPKPAPPPGGPPEP